MSAEEIASVVPVTAELLEDASGMRESLEIGIVLSTKEPGRYRHVYARGYLDALEDVRQGRLVLDGDHFRASGALFAIVSQDPPR